ncbi:FAD-dependent monooxygenase [Streptomyces sp. 71268]|uniref:FAD-dependent monooxygenase n=1 Tax=Streptomyces sp. 71268 TaxID=3002640 RepID=UPI0023F62D58|nr:FAD-dependent monooxygenase [Streptomyces sp. 71268]WEV24264.1 FAD-dependent monooxygenase [Streptomyces sp. 71268]
MTIPLRETPGDKRPVLIVGGGPVGLVLGCELLSQGVPVRIIDGTPPGSALHSRAIVVWPRSLELLSRVGAAEPLAEAGNRLDAVSYYSQKRPLGSIEMSRLKDTPYPFGLVIPQDRTEDVVRDRLVALGGKVEHGEVTGLDNSGGRPVVEVTWAGGRTEQIESDWVIGADGAHSSVRRLAGIAFLGSGEDVLFAIGDGPIDGDLHHHELLYCYTRGGALGFAPFGGGLFRLAVSVPGWTEGHAPPRALFQRVMDERAPRRGLIGPLNWTTIFRARRRVAETLRDGRVFLAGDAGHIFSAAGAQGMNTGIQDAVNLGWKLAGVIRGTLEPGILDSYDSERRTAAERVVLTTAKQTSWGLFHRRKDVAVRDTLVRVARRTGALQRFGAPLMAQHDVTYRPAETLWDTLPSLTRQARVGDRLPVFSRHGPAEGAAAGATPGGGRWPTIDPELPTLLMWAGERQHDAWARQRAALLETLPAEFAAVDISGWPGFRPLLGKQPRAVLVRPDGHIASLIAPEPTELRIALRRARVVLPGPLPGASVGGETVTEMGASAAAGALAPQQATAPSAPKKARPTAPEKAAS